MSTAKATSKRTAPLRVSSASSSSPVGSSSSSSDDADDETTLVDGLSGSKLSSPTKCRKLSVASSPGLRIVLPNPLIAHHSVCARLNDTHDMIDMIFSFLNLQTLLRIRRVCKRWKRLVASRHLPRHQVALEQLKLGNYDKQLYPFLSKAIIGVVPKCSQLTRAGDSVFRWYLKLYAKRKLWSQFGYFLTSVVSRYDKITMELGLNLALEQHDSLSLVQRLATELPLCLVRDVVAKTCLELDELARDARCRDLAEPLGVACAILANRYASMEKATPLPRYVSLQERHALHGSFDD